MVAEDPMDRWAVDTLDMSTDRQVHVIVTKSSTLVVGSVVSLGGGYVAMMRGGFHEAVDLFHSFRVSSRQGLVEGSLLLSVSKKSIAMRRMGDA